MKIIETKKRFIQFRRDDILEVTRTIWPTADDEDIITYIMINDVDGTIHTLYGNQNDIDHAELDCILQELAGDETIEVQVDAPEGLNEEIHRVLVL